LWICVELNEFAVSLANRIFIAFEDNGSLIQDNLQINEKIRIKIIQNWAVTLILYLVGLELLCLLNLPPY